MNKYQKLLVENRELIIAELAERMKDVVYVNAERKAEYAFDNIILRGVTDGEASVLITHEFRFVMNDLFQVAARNERTKDDHFEGCKFSG